MFSGIDGIVVRLLVFELNGFDDLEFVFGVDNDKGVIMFV